MNPDQQTTENDTTVEPRAHWPVSLLSSVVSIINTILPLVLVRLLTPEEIGLYRIFFLYITALPTIVLSTGFLNGIAFWSGQGTRGLQALQLTGFLSLLTGVIAALVIFALSPSLAPLLDWPSELVMLFALASIGAVSGFYFEEAAISTGRSWTGAIFLSSAEVARTSSIIIAALVWRDLSVVVLAHTLVILLKTITGFVLAHRLKLFSLTPAPGQLRAVLRYAVPVSCAGVLHLLINQIDKFILSTWLTKSEFALYAIGCLSLGPLLVVEHSITRVLIPQLAELFEKDAHEQAARIYSTAIRQISYFMIPSVIGLVTFADPLIVILFTEQYAQSSSYLRLFALWYLFFIVPFDAVARAQGDAGWPLRTFARLSLVTVPLTALLTYLFGAFGALSAMLMGSGYLRVLTLQYSLTRTRWSLATLLPPQPLLAVSLFSGLGALFSLALKPLFTSEIIWFFSFAPAGLLLIILFCLVVENSCRYANKQVLVLVQSLQTGGIERLAVKIATELQKDSQFVPSIFAYDQNETTLLELEARKEGLTVHIQPKSAGLSFGLILRLACLSYTQKIGIIHTQDLGALMYAALARCVSLNRFRIVHTQHSFIHLERNSKYPLYEKIFSKFADRITVVSPTLLQIYSDLEVPTEAIQVITNGVEFPKTLRAKDKRAARSDLIPEITAPKDSIWILYLARLYPQKGHLQALRIWNKLAPELRGSCSLLMIGPEAQEGYLQEIKAQIETSPDSDRIFTPGGTSQPFDWIVASDIFFSASESEGMPLSCIEAVGCGIPTVLSDIEGHKFLKDKTRQFPLESPEEGARILTEVIRSHQTESSRSLLETYSDAGHFREQYSFKSMVSAYLAVYKSSLTPFLNLRR